MARLSETQKRYRQYLQTPTWEFKRRQVVWRAKGMCEACGFRPHSENPGNVHHDRYPNEWGTEPLDWLRYLCRACHRAWHRAHPEVPNERDLLTAGKPAQPLAQRRAT